MSFELPAQSFELPAQFDDDILPIKELASYFSSFDTAGEDLSDPRKNFLCAFFGNGEPNRLNQAFFRSETVPWFAISSDLSNFGCLACKSDFTTSSKKQFVCLQIQTDLSASINIPCNFTVGDLTFSIRAVVAKKSKTNHYVAYCVSTAEVVRVDDLRVDKFPRNLTTSDNLWQVQQGDEVVIIFGARIEKESSLLASSFSQSKDCDGGGSGKTIELAGVQSRLPQPPRGGDGKTRGAAQKVDVARPSLESDVPLPKTKTFRGPILGRRDSELQRLVSLNTTANYDDCLGEISVQRSSLRSSVYKVKVENIETTGKNLFELGKIRKLTLVSSAPVKACGSFFLESENWGSENVNWHVRVSKWLVKIDPLNMYLQSVLLCCAMEYSRREFLRYQTLGSELKSLTLQFAVGPKHYFEDTSARNIRDLATHFDTTPSWSSEFKYWTVPMDPGDMYKSLLNHPSNNYRIVFKMF